MGFLVAMCTGTVYASCTAVSEGQQVPALIKRGECFELQGNNQFSDLTVVEGKMFLKAGIRLDISRRVEIRVQKKGEFGVRGLLSMGDGAVLNLAEFGHLNVEGELYIKQDSFIAMSRSSTLDGPGKVRFFPSSTLKMDRDSVVKVGD